MEKAQAGQFQLFNLLLESRGGLSLKEAQAQIGLSRSTLLKYQEALADLFAQRTSQVSLRLEDEMLHLDLGLGRPAQSLYQLFLEGAIKYQILLYLLKHQHFGIQQLALELLISEATLNRHLAGLNQLLSEFDLKIQNGSLKGPELQIRYFYLLLLDSVWTKEQLEGHCQHDFYEKEILLVEHLARVSLNLHQRRLLQIWFYVTKKRLTVREREVAGLHNLLAPFQDNVFYQRVHQQTLRYYMRYAIETDESESMSLFAFLVSFFILPSDMMEYTLGFGGPIVDKMTQSLRLLRQLNLLGDYTSEHVTYQLGQIFGQSYFFKGYLLLSESSYVLERLKLDMKEHLLVQQLGEQFLNPGLSGDQILKLAWDLGQTLYYMVEEEAQGLRLGLDFFGNEMTRYRLTHALQLSLEHNSLISLEPYDEQKSYDLILSNKEVRTYPSGAAVYYLQGPFNVKDQEAIRAYLQDLGVGQPY
ncbi:helix-turn-helix domain-containing protein [Streptococcus oricebi]|nr:helix-turn-helix domain-containing protein [Streptococcus oricebi]